MIRLIGGEMAAWTEDRPPAGGALFGHLVELLPEGSSVLVAGPHEDTLVDTLTRRATVTCLVRSQAAAATLDARGIRVLCGTLAKLTDAERYDVVVALDGLDRLCSVEGPQLDWVESLRALKRALKPGGTLLLAVENELGVHRLVDPAAATGAQTDGAWRSLGEFDTKPGSPARLRERLTAEGLTTGWVGAAWPVPQAPTLIATPEALRDGPADALAAAAARATATAFAEKCVLSDPRRLAAAAVRGGAGPEFAASWLVLAHLAAEPTPAVALPPILLGDRSVIEVAAGADGRWVRHVVRAGPGGGVPDGPLPPGRLLEELLLGACLRRDLPALRRLLTGWIAALPETTADNVVVDHDAYAVLDPGVPAEDDVLRRFARTLLAGGYPHPWPVTDVQSLTVMLRAASGDAGDVTHIPAGDEPPLPNHVRELGEQLRTAHQQLADATERNDWYQRELDRRERELRKLRVQNAAFSGTVGYRIAKLGYGLARKAKSRLRKRT